MKRQLESELMEAGAHLCFSKPRSGEEAGAVFQLVDALSGSKGFYPNGAFKGLAPARLCNCMPVPEVSVTQSTRPRRR